MHGFETSVRSKTSNKKKIWKCNYRCSMLSTKPFDKLCT